MNYTYKIKASPNPDNPNEQPIGGPIFDHRLYGKEVAIVTTQDQSYVDTKFTKVKESSTLSSSVIPIDENETVVLTIKSDN